MLGEEEWRDTVELVVLWERDKENLTINSRAHKSYVGT